MRLNVLSSINGDEISRLIFFPKARPSEPLKFKIVFFIIILKKKNQFVIFTRNVKIFLSLLNEDNERINVEFCFILKLIMIK